MGVSKFPNDRSKFIAIQFYSLDLILLTVLAESMNNYMVISCFPINQVLPFYKIRVSFKRNVFEQPSKYNDKIWNEAGLK